MRLVRTMLGMTIAIAVGLLIATWLAVESRAQAPERGALTGAWTLNRDQSDQPPSRDDRDRRDDRGGARRGGYGRGGMGRGGFGGGGGMGRAGGRTGGDPEAMARMRDAMRDVMGAPDHLTIVQTE